MNSRHLEIEKRLTGSRSPYAIQPMGMSKYSEKRYLYGPKHLLEIYNKAARRGARSFLTEPGGQQTYEDIFSRAAALRGYLVNKCDVQPLDHIAIAIGNGPAWIVAFFGIISTGAIPVLVGNHEGEQYRYWRNLLDYRVTVTTEADAHSVTNNGDEQAFVFLDREGFLQHRLTGGLVVEVYNNASPDDVAMITFTSGTTGRPKGVALTHRGITTGLMNMMLSGAILATSTKVDRAVNTAPCPLVLAPLSHVSGYVQVLLAAHLGGRLAMVNFWDADKVLEFFHKEHLTSLVGGDPALIKQLLEHPQSGSALSSLKTWNVTGSHIRRGLVELLNALFPDVVLLSSYGLTESNGGICATILSEVTGDLRACGHLVPTADIKITDGEGIELPDDEVGDIWIRGSMMMARYLPEERNEGRWKKGWFLTNDRGSISADRILRISDRVEDGPKSQSFVAQPALEHFLADRPDIYDVCVVPPEANGDGSIAVLVVPSRSDPSVGQRIKKLLCDNWCIQESGCSVFAVAQLPRTKSGKMDRIGAAQIAQMLLQPSRDDRNVNVDDH